MTQQAPAQHHVELQAQTPYGTRDANTAGADRAGAHQPGPDRAGADTGRRTFLDGPFAPVTQEVTEFDLAVTGRIPAELDGRYLRNGPNALGLEDPRAHHWMLGEGMVHGIRLRDGRAEWYRNRWVRSSSVARQLGEPYGGPVPDNDFAPNTHVIGYKGRIMALQEAGPLPYELDGDLNTIGPYDFGGSLHGSFMSHTKYDAQADELHAVTYFPTWDHVRHLVVDRTGRVVRTTRIPVSDSPMLHDFALTEKYVVLFDIPITFDPQAAGDGTQVPYRWNEQHPARVGVMPRNGGAVRWFAMDPVYYSHTLNAYDEGDRVIVDLTTFPAPFLVNGRGAYGPSSNGAPSLERWTIDLAAGRVHTRRHDDRPQEFPRLNESLVSRPYRYGYSVSTAELYEAYEATDGVPTGQVFTNALIKHDLLRGSSQVRELPRGATAGEPVFVPASGHDYGHGADAAAAEDDGYVLAYVHNPDRGAADLLILSAQDFTGEPVGTVHLPGRVPFGLHGSWVADEAR